MLQALLSIVTMPDAKEEEREGCTENAIFALGNIITNPVYRAEGMVWGNVNVQTVVQLWLQGLPLSTDEKTAKV